MIAILSDIHANVEALDAVLTDVASRDVNAIYCLGDLIEYLFPESIYDAQKMDAIAADVDSHCFCGHSHIPGVFARENDAWTYTSPADIGPSYTVTKHKTICTVGSVGQPRDGDTRACYVLFDGDTIVFRRVPYDIERTIAKIKADSDNDIDGDRYRYGR